MYEKLNLTDTEYIRLVYERCGDRPFLVSRIIYAGIDKTVWPGPLKRLERLTELGLVKRLSGRPVKWQITVDGIAEVFYEFKEEEE